MDGHRHRASDGFELPPFYGLSDGRLADDVPPVEEAPPAPYPRRRTSSTPVRPYLGAAQFVQRPNRGFYQQYPSFPNQNLHTGIGPSQTSPNTFYAPLAPSFMTSPQLAALSPPYTPPLTGSPVQYDNPETVLYQVPLPHPKDQSQMPISTSQSMTGPSEGTGSLKKSSRRRSQSATVKNPERYKTELCRNWLEKGKCRYGSKCQFSHGQGELRQVARHPRYKTELCKAYHVSGACPYGARCRFIHTVRKEEGQGVDSQATEGMANMDASLVFKLSELLRHESSLPGFDGLVGDSSEAVSPMGNSRCQSPPVQDESRVALAASASTSLLRRRLPNTGPVEEMMLESKEKPIKVLYPSGGTPVLVDLDQTEAAFRDMVVEQREVERVEKEVKTDEEAIRDRSQSLSSTVTAATSFSPLLHNTPLDHVDMPDARPLYVRETRRRSTLSTAGRKAVLRPKVMAHSSSDGSG